MKLDVSRPFRVEDALAAGLTKRDLNGPDYRMLLRGCYVSASEPVTTLVRCDAVALLVPDATFSHHTAAALWKAGEDVDQIHVSVGSAVRLRRDGIQTHRRSVLPETGLQRGHTVTTPEQTFADLGSYLDLSGLVELGDRLVRRAGTTPAALQRFVAGQRGRPGRLTREAARLVRPGVDSVRETKLRLMLLAAGLPEPIVNHLITDDAGTILRRIDLGYPELMIAIEYDGRHHIERKDQWNADILRREELEDRGWKFIVVTAENFEDKAGVVRRVRQARAERMR